MRFAALTLLAAALGVACAFLVACGSSNEKLIPGNDAASLKSYADRVGADVRSGNCNAQIAADVARARAKINALPSSVDPDLRQNLVDGFNNLYTQATTACQGSTETTTETTPTETTTTETTETTDTTDTGTTDTTPTQPDTGGGDGNGGGSDSGGSTSGGTGTNRSPLDRRNGTTTGGGTSSR
jgi:hypothetical protein